MCLLNPPDWIPCPGSTSYHIANYKEVCSISKRNSNFRHSGQHLHTTANDSSWFPMSMQNAPASPMLHKQTQQNTIVFNHNPQFGQNTGIAVCCSHSPYRSGRDLRIHGKSLTAVYCDMQRGPANITFLIYKAALQMLQRKAFPFT